MTYIHHADRVVDIHDASDEQPVEVLAVPIVSGAIANSLGLSDVREVSSVGSSESVGSIGTKSVGSLDVSSIKSAKVGSRVGVLRREWRIVAVTGELRGLCWRERDTKRKAVRYVGKRSNPEEFKIYTDAYERWRRANRTLDGAGIIATYDAVGKRGRKSGNSAG